jgi:hypothetical protein
MFIRKKFVTNSSSASYLIYGSWIGGTSIPGSERLIKHFLGIHPKEKIIMALEKVTGRDIQELATDYPEILETLDFETLDKITDDWCCRGEFITALLPPTIEFIEDEYREDDYLCINKNLRLEELNGRLVLKHITVEDKKALMELLDKIGVLEEPSIQSFDVPG